MRNKTCPGCQKYVALEAVQCECGHSFDKDIAGRWSDGLKDFHVPQTGFAWILVFLAAPITTLGFGFLAWIDWFHLSYVAGYVLTGLVIALPLASQVLPSFRKENGGCCLGCLVWMSVGIGIFAASAYWSFDDPVRSRETKFIPRLEEGVPITLGGVGIGSSREEVEKLKGRGRQVAYPTCPLPGACTLTWDDGTSVVFFKNKAVKVRASSLEQSGKVLAKSGDSQNRITHLFESSSFATPHRQYTLMGVQYSFEVIEGIKLGRIDCKSGTSILFKRPAESVSGVTLGALKSELVSPTLVEGNLWKVGEVMVTLDEFDRVISVEGNSVEKNGEPLLKLGEPMTSVGKPERSWRGRECITQLGPGELVVHAEDQKISRLIWSFPE